MNTIVISLAADLVIGHGQFHRQAAALLQPFQDLKRNRVLALERLPASGQVDTREISDQIVQGVLA